MTDRLTTIRTVLEGVYGKGAMVRACAESLNAKWDHLGDSYQGLKFRATDHIWMWFPGGDTAELAASELIYALGEPNGRTDD